MCGCVTPGERGITLSGGQKHRVSLARAVYSDADIYVLDDVLSAVDPKVAELLMQRCILGALKHKTRLMVTHALHYLHHADLVLLLGDRGEIADAGTFQELRARGPFAWSAAAIVAGLLSLVGERMLASWGKPRTAVCSPHTHTSCRGVAKRWWMSTPCRRSGHLPLR